MKESDEVEAVSVAGAAACVTLTVCERLPPSLNVTIAVRAAPLFAAAVMLTEPLPEPDEDVSVSHVAPAALTLAVQLMLDVTVTVFVSPAAVKESDEVETVRSSEIIGWNCFHTASDS